MRFDRAASPVRALGKSFVPKSHLASHQLIYHHTWGAVLEALQLRTTIYCCPQSDVQYHSTLRQSSNFGALRQICSRPVPYQRQGLDQVVHIMRYERVESQGEWTSTAEPLWQVVIIPEMLVGS